MRMFLAKTERRRALLHTFRCERAWAISLKLSIKPFQAVLPGGSGQLGGQLAHSMQKR